MCVFVCVCVRRLQFYASMYCLYNSAGVDLISGVTCKAPYEWVDKTDKEWDFNSNQREKETFHVSFLMCLY